MTVARAQRACAPHLGAAAFLDSAVAHLDLPQAVFDGMLEEFDRQQAARGLTGDTRRGRERLVRQLRASSGSWPWEWTPAHFDSWTAAHLRAGRTKSTMRGYQNAIVAFTAFVADPRYQWGLVSERLFAAVPGR